MRTLPVLALLALAACSPDAPDASPEAPAPEVTGREALSIVTTGGEVRLGLTDEVLYVRLTDQAAGAIEDEMRDKEAEGGIGGAIVGAVAGAVGSALTTPIEIPLEDVEDVRYENGRLEIDLEGSRQVADFEVDDEPFEEQFAPEDARRFAETFRELKGR